MRFAIILALSGLGPTLARGQQARDSAGIRIVENRRPGLPPAKMWRVTAQPFLQIGSADPDSAYELLRVMGVARLADGRVAVANSGSSSVRFYDRAGKYLGAFGREGDGPGEFRQILGMAVIRGDSLVVTDFNRLSYHSGTGAFARVYSPAAEGRRFIYPWKHLPDGSYVGIAGRPSDRTDPRGGRWTDSVTLFRVGPAPSALDSLGRFPVGQRIYSAAVHGAEPVVFSPSLRVTGFGTRVYVGYPERYEIGVYSFEGRLQRLIRRADPPRPTPAAAIRAYQTRYANRPNEDGTPASSTRRERLARLADGLAFAERLPAYSTLLTDATGHLWVRQYETWENRPDAFGLVSVHTEPRPSHWDVFDPAGAWLGGIDLPANFTPLDIGTDYVAGLWRDADDIEYVRFYRLTRP